MVTLIKAACMGVHTKFAIHILGDGTIRLYVNQDNAIIYIDMSEAQYYALDAVMNDARDAVKEQHRHFMSVEFGDV